MLTPLNLCLFFRSAFLRIPGRHGFAALGILVSMLIGSDLSWSQSDKSALMVSIDHPNFRKLIMAIPPITVPPQLSAPNTPQAGGSPAAWADTATQELRRLLNFSGHFNVSNLTTGATPGTPTSGDLAGVDVVQWKALGVEGLVMGQLVLDGNQWALEMRAIDIRQGKLLVGKKYNKISGAVIKERMAHFADKILEAYTGKPGIFSTRLVFVGRKNKGDPKQIYVSLFDGSGAYPITTGNSPHLSPSWSRDGRYITYTSFEDKNPDLFIFDTATGKKRKLSGRKGLNSGANWSNNNKLIAFTGSVDGDADIYLTSPDGDQQRVLIKGTGLDVDPMFSPDGKWLAFVSGRFGNPHIFRGELQWDGETKVRVLNDKRLTFAGWYNATPTWSPDSEKLVFAGYDKEIDRFDLFMMNPDGTQLERLTLRAGDNERPSFSPNGQLIVFHSSRGPNRENVKGTAQLFLMNRDGSNQRKLETGLFEAQTPQWSLPLAVDDSKF